MVIDSSALIAILRGEPEEDEFIRLIAGHPDPIISAATLLEARMVAESKLGSAGKEKLEELVAAGGVRTVAFDEAQAAIAHEAWRNHGRGSEPAQLNFGDCISYALAKQAGRSLLFKGDDFTQTDLNPAG